MKISSYKSRWHTHENIGNFQAQISSLNQITMKFCIMYNYSYYMQLQFCRISKKQAEFEGKDQRYDHDGGVPGLHEARCGQNFM